MISNIDEDFTDPDYAMYAVTGRDVSTGDWDSPAFVASLVNA